MRLIDADAIKIPNTEVSIFENCRYCGLLDKEQIEEIIAETPTIDLVRCGECMHYDDGLCRRPKWAFAVEETGFCNYGERRNDERINE